MDNLLEQNAVVLVPRSRGELLKCRVHDAHVRVLLRAGGELDARLDDRRAANANALDERVGEGALPSANVDETVLRTEPQTLHHLESARRGEGGVNWV